jgi:hypothetical protein
MSAFYDDLNEEMKDPWFAYQFGRDEREMEIIALIEDNACRCNASGCVKFDMGDAETITAFIKGENNE